MIEQLRQLIQTGIDRIREVFEPRARRAPATIPVRSSVTDPRRDQ